nr:hypothetical protein [uncultured Holophaga sp.]
MSTLISATYAAAAVASASQDRLSALILAAGEDPSVETITAAKQAETQSAFATKTLKKAQEVARSEAEDLASLFDQSSGIGQNLDLQA